MSESEREVLRTEMYGLISKRLADGRPGDWMRFEDEMNAVFDGAALSPGPEPVATDECGHAASSHNEYGCFTGMCPCETPQRDIVHGPEPVAACPCEAHVHARRGCADCTCLFEPVAGLDVERLARAIEKVLPVEEDGIVFKATYTAIDIAREYAALSPGPEPVAEWRCDWVPDDLNPGPDCPYCAGDMCARIDGLNCTHDRRERHGPEPVAGLDVESDCNHPRIGPMEPDFPGQWACYRCGQRFMPQNAALSEPKP